MNAAFLVFKQGLQFRNVLGKYQTLVNNKQLLFFMLEDQIEDETALIVS
jgi:hypothetical protein